MNVEIKLVDGLENPYAVIYTETISEEIQNIVSFLEAKKGVITAVSEDRTIVLREEEIYLIRIENKETEKK